ncbi:hypothetical protein VTO73DRAFT_9291 [Trametes versicolor]
MLLLLPLDASESYSPIPAHVSGISPIGHPLKPETQHVAITAPPARSFVFSTPRAPGRDVKGTHMCVDDGLRIVKRVAAAASHSRAPRMTCLTELCTLVAASSSLLVGQPSVRPHGSYSYQYCTAPSRRMWVFCVRLRRHPASVCAAVLPRPALAHTGDSHAAATVTRAACPSEGPKCTDGTGAVQPIKDIHSLQAPSSLSGLAAEVGAGVRLTVYLLWL